MEKINSDGEFFPDKSRRRTSYDNNCNILLKSLCRCILAGSNSSYAETTSRGVFPPAVKVLSAPCCNRKKTTSALIAQAARCKQVDSGPGSCHKDSKGLKFTSNGSSEPSSRNKAVIVGMSPSLIAIYKRYCASGSIMMQLSFAHSMRRFEKTRST